MNEVRCQYCQEMARLVQYCDEEYPYRSGNYGPIYVCIPCSAWVGCHPNTTKALGVLANAELRVAKQAAHAAFDPLWQRNEKCSRMAARRAGYKWLGAQLGLCASETHIGMFDVATCNRVVEICHNLPEKAKSWD